MKHDVVTRASGKLDLTGVYLYHKGKSDEARAGAPVGPTRDLRPVYAGILVWAGVLSVLWLFG
jgi:hypothetical protein